MGRIILVTGGARSGKSRYAEQLAAGLGANIAYVATAKPLDAEMEDRIARHRRQRPAAWRTFEAAVGPSAIIAAEGGPQVLPLLSKEEVAARILDRVVELWKSRHQGL